MKSVVLGVAPVFLCAAILMTGRANARLSASLPNSSGNDSIVQTSICEILKDPLLFDGAMVQVRATVLAGFEVFAVQDATGKDCGTVWLSYEGGGPTASVSLGLLTPQVERPPVPLKRDRQFKRFQKLLSEHMYPRKREDGCIGCNRYEVTASLTGRLDAAGEGMGFGHMNAYHGRLVLQRVADLSTVDLSSNYDPMKFSTTPIAFPKGRLRARVIEGTGKPVNNAEVTLRLMTDESPHYHDLIDWADEKGRVTFDDIPPGRYLAGVN